MISNLPALYTKLEEVSVSAMLAQRAPWVMLGQLASEVRPGHRSGQGVVKGPRRSGVRLTGRLSNNAMQPTACAVGKQVKNSNALAPAAADGER